MALSEGELQVDPQAASTPEQLAELLVRGADLVDDEAKKAQVREFASTIDTTEVGWGQRLARFVYHTVLRGGRNDAENAIEATLPGGNNGGGISVLSGVKFLRADIKQAESDA